MPNNFSLLNGKLFYNFKNKNKENNNIFIKKNKEKNKEKKYTNNDVNDFMKFQWSWTL